MVSVVALEVSDGSEDEFLSLTGQLQAMIRTKGYGTNQLLQDGSNPLRYYDVRIWCSAEAAAKAEGDNDITGLRLDLAKYLQSTPLVDVAWAVEVGLTAAGPWRERRELPDRRRAQIMPFTGPERRVAQRRALHFRLVEPLSSTAGTAQGRSSDSPQAISGEGDGVLPGIVSAARNARERAIAPFSDFKVGAALETADGRVVTGCNIENSTYGLTMCAERVAIFKALSEGHRSFTRIAIVADTSQTTSPCGACRQMLWEFAGDIEVILANLTAITTTHQLKDLLPHPFDARFIE
jgi:cytidine deaminase